MRYMSDSEITTKLMLAMRKQIDGKPLAKWWPKFEGMIKRQGRHPDWNADVLDAQNWRSLFEYGRRFNVPVLNQPLRGTFGTGYNLCHRQFH